METLKELQELAEEKNIAYDYLVFADHFFCEDITYACLASDNELYTNILRKAYELEVF